MNNDLISRQAAIDEILGQPPELHYPSWYAEQIKQLPSAQPEPCEDTVSRKDCLKALSNMMDTDGFRNGWAVSRANVECMLKAMPPVTPKQSNLSEAYANAVFTWLMSYQIQSAQLKGRYTPYEVIGWVLNDWRKEHDAERDT